MAKTTKYIIYSRKTKSQYYIDGRALIFDSIENAAQFCQEFTDYTIMARNFRIDVNHIYGG